jgi:hypothetical protein
MRAVKEIAKFPPITKPQMDALKLFPDGPLLAGGRYGKLYAFAQAVGITYHVNGMKVRLHYDANSVKIDRIG